MKCNTKVPIFLYFCVFLSIVSLNKLKYIYTFNHQPNIELCKNGYKLMFYMVFPIKLLNI